MIFNYSDQFSVRIIFMTDSNFGPLVKDYYLYYLYIGTYIHIYIPIANNLTCQISKYSLVDNQPTVETRALRL